ncbi:UbiA prenyltransferase family protein [Tanacetum coccineum]
MMKSMQIESVLKPSPLQSRLGPVAVVSRHEEGGVSWINVGKTARLEHSSAKFSMLNAPQNANIYVSKVGRRESKFLSNAFSESFENIIENASESEVVRPQINRGSILTMLTVIYKYARIYTVKGSALSIISISLLAVQSFSDFSPSFFLGVLQALLGGVFANLYVAGFNQLSDIDIDKVNKPYLVLASGELPVRIAVLVTLLYAILTSIPGRTILLSKHAIFVSAFMSVHAIVNALLKDIPDVEGDKINGIDSFALRFGQKRVIAHGIFGFTLWRKANLVDLDSKEATESFYLFYWKVGRVVQKESGKA